MNKFINQHENSIDFKFLLIVIILVLLGFVMVFSASTLMAEKRFGDEFYFLKRHLVWLSLGFIAMFVGSKINYKIWQKVSFPLVILTFIFLVAVLIPGIGVSVGGARRWFRFGFLGFQPSEFAKLSLVMYTSSWLTRKNGVFLVKPGVYMPKLIMVGVMLLLIFKEPDLGTTVLITSVIFSLHFIGGLKKR
jgi:cell division protein FtsW